MEHFGDIGPLDDNDGSFLLHDGGDGRDLCGTTEHKKESSKGNFLYIVCSVLESLIECSCNNATVQVSPLLKLVV